MSTPSQPLVFEGPDPKRLLLEVFATHGPGAKISEPVAIRKGGVFGFFAKMHYRVEVVPSMPPQPAGNPAPTSATPRTGPVVPGAPAVPAAESATGAALAWLIEQTEDEVDLNSSRQESFEEILDKVASSLGEEPEAELALLGAHLGATAPPVTSPPRPDATRPARVLRDEEPANALLGHRCLAPLAPSDEVRTPPARFFEVSPAPSPMNLAVPPCPAHPKTMEEELAGLDLESTCSGALGRLALPAGLSSDLTLVGFPLRLLRARSVELTSLPEAFALAPFARAVPKTPGSLIAVVGSGGRARTAAKAIAVEIDMHAAIPRALARRGRSALDDHLVAHDAIEAADLSPGWRRGRAVVVTVSVPTIAGAGEWTRSVLGGLAPSMTLLVASATAKTEDVQARVAAIGGVDGLVLEDCGATFTPASVLSAGLPIARIDGEAASASAWVAVAERALERRSQGW